MKTGPHLLMTVTAKKWHQWTGSLIGTLQPVVLIGFFLLTYGPAFTQVDPGGERVLDQPGYFGRQTRSAIEKGLDYLQDVQHENGRFADKNPVAVTAVSLIAFMVNGHLPGEAPYGEAMNNGIEYLLKSQDEGGYIGSSMYAHGLATLALSEVWGLTERNDEVKGVLKSAVQLILHAQNKEGGWRYWPRPTTADVSVTAMQIVALASARQAGILVPDRTIERAVRYVKSCHDEASGGFNYQPRPHSNPAFGRTAAAVTSMMMSGKPDAKEVKAGVEYLLSKSDEKFKKTGHYSYSQYYAIQVMHRTGEETFSKWYPKIRNALLKKMNGKGAISGGSYSTAMGLIVLGMPRRFVPAYQR